MFEAAELGRSVPKDVYKVEEPKLQIELLKCQRELLKAEVPVIVIVAGVEGAGKSEVVNLLNQWLDARGIDTHAFLYRTDEEKAHPPHWQFWRRLPAKGKISVMLGSWYTKPIIDRVYENISEEVFEHQLHQIQNLERMLTDDGVCIIKLWFHLARDEQKRRAKAQKKREKSLYLSPFIGKFSKHYQEYVDVSQRAIRLTDVPNASWHVIEATKKRYRNLATGQTLLTEINRHLESNPVSKACVSEEVPIVELTGTHETILDHVDLSQQLSREDYKTQLEETQHELNRLAWMVWQQKRSLVAVFEGWDAAGKGGVIRRATGAIDARLVQVVPVGVPSDEEKSHHYLWRFWRQLPRDGKLAIFDRSWYGRVLVERVENFAAQEEWMRSYQEINEFEEQLTDHGVIVVKFWLHISPEEQFRRFKRREEIPWKQYKITAEDWRNREKWEEYKTAVNDMVIKTGTEYAPWHMVPSEDKRFGRVFVLKTLCERLQSAME